MIASTYTSWTRLSLVTTQILTLLIISLSFTGCDFLTQVTDFKLETTRTNATEAAGTTNNGVCLEAGYSTDDVRELLGQPSGMMVSSNRIVFRYGNQSLEFIDNQLTTFPPTVIRPASTNNPLAGNQSKDPEELSFWEIITNQTFTNEENLSFWELLAKKMKALSTILANKNDEISVVVENLFRKYFTVQPKPVSKTLHHVTLLNKKKQEIIHDALIVTRKITIVNFYSPESSTCLKLTQSLETFIKKQPEITLRNILIEDWSEETPHRYAVTSLPDVRVFDKKGFLVALPTSVLSEVERAVTLARENDF